MPTLFTLSVQVLAVTFGHLYIGYGLTYYAITQNTIAYILGFQDSSQKGMIDGIINALLPIGAAIGATVSSPLIHIISFRSTFILNDSIGIIVGCFSLYLNIYSISLCRLIYGFVIGINCTITVQYIHHIVPVKYNGFFGGMAQCLMMVGLTIGFAMQWVCLSDNPAIYNNLTNYGFLGFNNWRIVLFFPTIPCLIRLASFLIFFRGKLAYEYYEIGKIEDASRNLMQHYVILNSEIDQETQLQCKLQEIERELNKQHKHLSLIDLFTKKYRRQIIICCIFSFFQQWAGINAVNFYAGSILEEMTNNNYTIINMANVANGIVSTTSAVVSSYAINAHGRKIMLLVGNGCCFVSLTILSILMVTTEGNISVFIEISYMICLFSFIIGYSLSLGPVFWVYISEVLPPKGIDVVNCVNWIACALLAQVFPMVAASFEMYYNFMFFGLVCFLTELLVHYFLIETKGLTKGEISRKLQLGRVMNSSIINMGN